MLIGIALGLAIEIAIEATPHHGSRLLRQAGDDIADRMLRLAERTGGDPGTIAAPFVFVNIDDETWSRWGSPLVTPRDRLAKIIGTVARSGPALMIVDVDLAWSGVADSEKNERFKEFLAAYPPDAPPLLLVRSLVTPGDEDEYPRLRATPFDDVVPLHKAGSKPERAISDAVPAETVGSAPAPRIVWVTTRFVGDSDGLVRRWRLVEPVCRDGRPDVLPSAELVAAAAVTPGAREELAANLPKLVGEHCRAPHHSVPDVGIETLRVSFGESESGERIIYTIRWQPKRAALGPMVEFGGERVPLMSVRSAELIGEADDPIDGLAGRIVIVGGSFKDSEDLHKTPLGTMPGALVIANATHSLLRHGTPREPPLVVRGAISLGLVVVMAVLFHWLRPLVAGFCAGLAIFALMVATLPWLRSGVVLEFAIPSLGVLVHRLIALGEDTWTRFRRERWRAFLKRDHHAGG